MTIEDALLSNDPKKVLDVLLTEEWIKSFVEDGKSPSWIYDEILRVWTMFENVQLLHPAVFKKYGEQRIELEQYIAGKLGYV